MNQILVNLFKTMTNPKAAHKELKKEVNQLEERRKVDRGFKSWIDLKEAKKLKLKLKDKLHAS